MKKVLLLGVAGMLALTAKSQTIATARQAALNSNVTVKGVVVNGSELGIIRYLQDNTGGIAAYGANLSSVNLGDSIIVNGTLTSYNNLFEINPVTFTVVSANATIPTPQVITPAGFVESTEGTLVKFMNCSFGAAAGQIFPSTATNYTVTSNGQPFAVRTNTFLSGSTIPSGTVNLVGVSSQFCSNPSSGCTTGYQLLLRKNSDISSAPTGIFEIGKNNNTVSAYPNPVSSEISFNLANNEEVHGIVITDVLGNVVYSANENKNRINVSVLANGVYNLSVATATGNYQTKFIVVK